MSNFTTLVEYRDHTEDEVLIPIDSEDVVVGLQTFDVKPVEARTDGKKLIVSFFKNEVLAPFQRIQAAIAGIDTVPEISDLDQKVLVKAKNGEQVELSLLELFMVYYKRSLMARLGWKGLLTMMRHTNILQKA